jgi:hypothetical protein
VPQQGEWLEAFRKRYWDFYQPVRAYQQAPTPERPAQLREQFDELFSTVTVSMRLEQRIGKTKADKTHWLMDVGSAGGELRPALDSGPKLGTRWKRCSAQPGNWE